MELNIDKDVYVIVADYNGSHVLWSGAFWTVNPEYVCEYKNEIIAKSMIGRKDSKLQHKVQALCSTDTYAGYEPHTKDEFTNVRVVRCVCRKTLIVPGELL